MSKGPSPNRVVARATVLLPPTTGDGGVPHGAEGESCAGPVELEFDVTGPARVGLNVVVVPRDGELVLVARGQTVGRVRASGAAILACVSWGWSYRGTVTRTSETSGVAVVTGARN